MQGKAGDLVLQHLHHQSKLLRQRALRKKAQAQKIKAQAQKIKAQAQKIKAQRVRLLAIQANASSITACKERFG